MYQTRPLPQAVLTFNYMTPEFLFKPKFIKPALLFFLFVLFAVNASAADADWSAKFDSTVRFYQMTELGVMVVGTEKSLYAVSGETGEILWRLKGV